MEHHHSQVSHTSAIHPGIPHHVYVRILDEQGDLLMKSGSTLPPFPSLTFPIVAQKNQDAIAFNRVRSDDNQLFLLGSTWATTQISGTSQKLLLQVKLALAQDETLLSEFQQTLAAVLLFGAIASGLAAFWVARRGLRPLRKITQAIQNINVHQLNEPVDSAQWPQEIALLAKAFDQMLTRLNRSFAQLS